MKPKEWGAALPAVPAGAIGKLVAAAVIDQEFCRQLLANPLAAASSGFLSESFPLTPAEEALLLSVKNPRSLSDFARQVVDNYNSLR